MKSNLFYSSFIFMTLLLFGVTSAAAQQNSEKIPGFDLSNLDRTVSPTEDFYQYATGGWQKQNPIPETESRWGSFNILYESGQKKIKEIVLNAVKNKGPKGSDSQLIGDFYLSAMDSLVIEEEGLNVLAGRLNKIDMLSSYIDFPDFFAINKLDGIGNPFSLYVGTDKKNSNKYITYTSQSGLSLPDRDYYLKEDDRFKKIRAAYKDHLEKMFVLMGDNPATAAKNAGIVFDIEKKLAENSMSRIERRNPELTYNKMTLAEVQKLTPDFKWERYLKFSGLKTNEMIVSQVDFLKKTNDLLKSIPIEDWKIYYKWHLVDQFAGWLPHRFVKQNFAFYSGVLKGVDKMKSRQKRAVMLVNGMLDEPVGKLFVKKYFPESSKKEVEELIENLRSVYIDRIKQLDWMSEETKKKAIEKIKAFTYKIGYPEKWKDYSSIKIYPQSVVDNIISINQWKVKDNLAKLGKPVDKTEWGMSPQTINAYYNPVNNEVVFPAGILQPPFYDPKADIAINYGAIGGVIGHEFTHGFDDSGSKYDKNGNMNNWWTKEDREKFEAKTKIVVRQFDEYEPLPDVHVQGKLTLGENIADLGGLTLAYYALQKYYKKNGGRKNIAGFTPEQRFYLGWAQVWASNTRPEYVKQQVTSDPHSPSQYRVNGPMSNLDEFRKAWNAKPGDKMVRTGAEQAKIW